MTKEEIFETGTDIFISPVIAASQFKQDYITLQDVVSAMSYSMDFYAKQQAIAFIKWAVNEDKIVGNDYQGVHIPLMEEDIYDQFIEQQNKQ